MTGPTPCWQDDTCAVCPAQILGPGAFDVHERPGPGSSYRPELGYRATPDGTAVCVHPYRVALPAGAYASQGVPVPEAQTQPVPALEALELPDHLDNLEGWLIAVLRSVPAEEIFRAVARAERQAGQRFYERDVVRAMRKVLSRELARA